MFSSKAIDLRFAGYPQKVRDIAGSDVDPVALATLAVAYLVAFEQILPSSKVEDPQMYYAEQVARSIEEDICCANERVTIDLDRAMRVARGLWLARYYFIHPVEYVPLFTNESDGSVFHFVGAGAYLSAIDLAMFSTHTRKLGMLINETRARFNQEQ